MNDKIQRILDNYKSGRSSIAATSLDLTMIGCSPKEVIELMKSNMPERTKYK